MCGHVGIAGEITGKEERMFSDMLLLDTIRGKHSTGVAAVSSFGNAKNLHVVKAAKSAPDFMEEAGYKAVMGRLNKIIMGHNRFATRGAVTDENAHPFEFSNLVGAHNGSLLSFNTMFEHEKYTVDSQALYSNLNQHGVDDTWGKVDGAAALVWIDKTNLTVNFLRNKERPLYFCYGNKGRTLIWASEAWMIMVAAMRNNIEVEEKCHEVSINSLYTFSTPMTADKKEKVTVTRREVKPYVRPVTYSNKYYQGYDSYYSNGSSYKSEGQKFMDAAGVTYGDTVIFTVETIRDSKDLGGRAISTIIGKSIDYDVPIRIANMDTHSNEDLILEMWENDDNLFSATVSYADATGLVLNAYSAASCGYTLADLEEAELEQRRIEKENNKKKEEEENKEPEKLTLKVIPYKISCSYCRQMVNSYYASKEAGISVCCEECWEKELSGLTPTQRAAVRLGSTSRMSH